MRLSARGARVALFCLLLPAQAALAILSELGVRSDAAHQLACAYAALVLRLVACLLASAPSERSRSAAWRAAWRAPALRYGSGNAASATSLLT